MTVGGLYLPLPEHIETFCKTNNYNKCYHYVAGCDEIRNAAPKVEDGVVNRRRYRRIQERFSLQLAEPSVDGADTIALDEDAYTFDMSMGGLGFVTRRMISPETKVKFILKDSADSSPLVGAGVVRWTVNNSSDSDLFFSGLSFSDKKCQQIVGKRMWNSELSAV
jgi:hypothetical protein